MTVYVESNFVLEIALDQEQSNGARTLLDLAEIQEIVLAIPAFALSEPFSAVRRRATDRNTLVDLLQRQFNELGRSRERHEAVRSIEETQLVLRAIERQEVDSLVAVTNRVLRSADVIPMSSSALGQAVTYQIQYGFKKIQDALIYATIMGHLNEQASMGPHYFVTKDAQDFRDPEIATEMQVWDCELLNTFPEAVLRLRTQLPD